MIYWNKDYKGNFVKSSRKPIKSGKMPYIDDEDVDKFEERLNKGEEVKMKGWTFRKDDTGRISVIDPDGNLLDEDFKSVASFIDWFRYWKKDSLKSSRKAIKSSKFYVEYYDGADSGYVSYDNDSTIDFDNAITFNSRDEANEWVDEHKDEWKSELKVQEITNSRKVVKSGVDRETLIERINKVEPDDYSDWSVEELQELAINLGINISSSRKPLKQSHVADINYYKQLVKSVLSNRLSKDEALTKIASRNSCNKKYAETIYNNWMNKYKEQLIKSDAEIADIQKEFNVDGDIYSWAEDYMPGSGKANTKGGELVRAAHRILSEYYNNGNMIGRGFGNETTNPAARYIVEKTNFDGNGEIEDMLNHLVRMDDGQYNSWCKRFESDFANYLRSNAELFDEPNDDDIADYVDENDKEFFIKKFYVEDDFGNKYVFVDKEENFVCDEVDFAEPPAYNEGDVIKDGDEFSSEIDKNEEYGTFEKDGFTYDWEADSAEDENGNYDEWKIVRVTISDQLFEKEDVLDFEDIEKYKAFDMNGNELTEEELLSV